jgi:D-glycero-D-manno-heptose 1,7-bisphosphate phosphatase
VGATALEDSMNRAQGSATRRAAVFFDRDGVLNLDHGYVGNVERFEWIEGAPEAVRLVNQSGRLAFVVTNQSGVARGFFDEADVQAVHAHMQRELRGIGAHVDEFRYCAHHPHGSVARYVCDCGCRKPRPGMIVDLIARWNVDPAASLMIGDKPSDLEAARAAGVPAAHYTGGNLAEVLARYLEGGSETSQPPREQPRAEG